MREIAREELEHAMLSWALHEWAVSVLPADAASRARAAMSAAARELRAATCARTGAREPAWTREVGLPDAAQERALVAALDASFWAPLAS